MTTKHKAVGKRITQKDAVLKATGEGIYVADVNLPGQLWGKVLLLMPEGSAERQQLQQEIDTLGKKPAGN